jgi:TusA-related sulfurtransferase
MTNVLDLRGKRCPISTIELGKYLRKLPNGSSVSVYSDDSDSRVAFPGVFKKTGVTLDIFSEFEEYHSYTLTKS